ncbi:MAG: hypothetical protein QOE93_1086 [Actinomycetota bacterium]|nr:hypothetical protein [Actinomycetota bacterium]
MNSRRVPALVVILFLLVAGGAIDRWVRSSPDSSLAADAGPNDSGDDVAVSGPTAAPSSARSSAWYCTGATGVTGALADGTVVIANAGARPLRADVAVIPVAGEQGQTTLTVAANGRAAVHLADIVQGDQLSAVVELDGGDAVVELSTVGPSGASITPCASSASPTWYFAEGVTTRDATEVLLVLNPFPEDAVVDFAFTTEEGQVTPQALTGLAVQGRRMAAINVGDFVQRREAVAARINARTGRLVVARLQVFDGSVGRQGVSVTLGAPTPEPEWYFADGLAADGLAERFQVYNPLASEAQVELAIALDDGEAEPLRITVPRESRVSVVANDESRIPKGVGHAVTVRSTNGVDVVVERSVDSAGAGGRSGVGSSFGARAPAEGWVFAAGQADADYDEFLAVFNPGPAPAKVSVALLADGVRRDVTGLRDLDLPPGGRTVVRLADHVPVPAAALSVVVTGTNPVVAERLVLSQGGGLGISITPGIPLRG